MNYGCHHLKAYQVGRLSSIQRNHTIRARDHDLKGRRKGLLRRARRPPASLLPRRSNLKGRLYRDRGVGFTRGPLNLPQGRWRATISILFLRALGSIVVLTFANITPGPLASATIEAIPCATFLRGLAFFLFPSIPTTFSVLLGAFRLTIGYPRLEISPLRHRVHIRRYEDVLTGRIVVRPK